MISPCGYYCEKCPHSLKGCQGCRSIKGKPWWIKHYGGKPCPIYTCLEHKSLLHCGQCEALPCQIWMDMKDPAYSEEEHQAKIKSREQRLKEQL